MSLNKTAHIGGSKYFAFLLFLCQWGPVEKTSKPNWQKRGQLKQWKPELAALLMLSPPISCQRVSTESLQRTLQQWGRIRCWETEESTLCFPITGASETSRELSLHLHLASTRRNQVGEGSVGWHFPIPWCQQGTERSQLLPLLCCNKTLWVSLLIPCLPDNSKLNSRELILYTPAEAQAV